MEASHRYRYEVRDGHSLTDAEIAAAAALDDVLLAEVLPGEPPTPVARAVEESRLVPARYQRVAIRAQAPDGSLAGSAGFAVDPDRDDNPHVLEVGLAVHPAHRRCAVGSHLLARVAVLAQRLGRSRLIGHTAGRHPAGEAFAGAFGAEPKAWSHVNRLVLADSDRLLLERWVAEAPVRAAGYELLAFDDGVPDEHIEAFADLVLVMNTAPRDELDLNDFTLTPDQLRESHELHRRAGHATWTLVARRVADGAFAGFHQVSWHPAHPTVVQVHDTGVRLEHRGHALGKWLKAAMTLRILDERPAAREVRTGNADSNDAMLGINREMGYRPMLSHTVWEATVEAVEVRLAGRRVPTPTL